MRHLLLAAPADWSNEKKGSFFEDFISEIIIPMRLRTTQRIRVTGMELDLLAQGEDEPITVLVECKAQRDPIAADVISKLIGNVRIRKADKGWLFSTSDFTKDGRGLWSEIQKDQENARIFTWYSPAKTIDVLASQKRIVDPATLEHYLTGMEQGDWSLIVAPGSKSWLVELLEDGIPNKFSVFDAKTGIPLNNSESLAVAAASPRYTDLQFAEVAKQKLSPTSFSSTVRAPVARVIAGDAWADPRPARPIDFVGRDEILREIAAFIDRVRTGLTPTRSFAIHAPSGWGKSSLGLTLVSQAQTGTIPSCTVTAVDSRSATSAAFVAEALRLAVTDSLISLGPNLNSGPIKINSLREPLDSPEIIESFSLLRDRKHITILHFDQFEELIAKEKLFEVFNAVRDLSLDVDAQQLPLILGFAWKTDIALAQQHPAYHLWHELADRRLTLKVNEFGRSEVRKMISKGEKSLGKILSRALRSRLEEQCQGLPWLLKKLLVHVLDRVSTPESPYLLLERELDIEQLFKDDLQQLQEEHVRCLKFVAGRSPVSVAEVGENFSTETTAFLINKHLLVRSGMNYVVYWDIFRDYLVEERVPQIPWARKFQRTPPIALKALDILHKHGPLTAVSLAERLNLKEGPTFNVLGDLVALQLVDTEGSNGYRVAAHLKDLSAPHIAAIVSNQLKRHVVTRAIEKSWPKEKLFSHREWLTFFEDAQPGVQPFSTSTLRQYSSNFRSWLIFSGILEQRRKGLARADGRGGQMGKLAERKTAGRNFIGSGNPTQLLKLLSTVFSKDGTVERADLVAAGLRRVIADVLALDLMSSNAGILTLRYTDQTMDDLTQRARQVVLSRPEVLAAQRCRALFRNRTEAARQFAAELGESWKISSAVRNYSSLLRYMAWAQSASS